MRKEKTEKEKTQKQLKERFFLRTPFDLNLVLDIVFLNVFGMVMIYSASFSYAVTAYGYEPEYFFKNQLIYVAAGIAAMILISFFRPKFFKYFWIPSVFVAAAFLAAVRIPGVGHASHGAFRWIKLGGFTLQIAEPIKICLILFFAGYFTKFRVQDRLALWFLIFLYCGFSAGFLLLSNNMSTAMVVFCMMFFSLMVISPKEKWYVILLAFGAAALFAGIILVQHVIPYNEEENFRITRIRAWLNPDDVQFSDNEAYQAKMALYAIASGGFFGKGLGQSLMKFTLPEPHNDYILAIVFEELGIFGALLLTFLFIYLFYKLFTIYRDSQDRFSGLLVLGVFFHITTQVLFNYAVTLGILPTMGVTLPFISAGGSSAFFTLCELGIVLSVQRQNLESRLYKEAEQELTDADPYYRSLKEQEAEEKPASRVERRADAR